VTPVARPLGIQYKTRDEVALMREASQIVAQVLDLLERNVRPGVSTLELDELAEAETARLGARPAFKGYRVRGRTYEHSLCASRNDVVVHGIPSAETVLGEGDILGIDFGVVHRGYFGDSARTLPVGQVSEEQQRLMQVTREALHLGIAECVPGGWLGSIGHAIQSHVEQNGYSVVRAFVGHGIGRALHEEPPVPNYGRRGHGLRLHPGLVLAIEPMVNAGAPEVKILEDGWTAVTVDGAASAHFEHTVAITDQGPVILSQL
jgi:methionyl aminopeptidase